MKNMVFKKLIDPDSKKIFVIAEMSGNHKNSFSTAKNFIYNAIKAKADIIKFQVYTPDTITINSRKKDFLVNSKSEWGNYKTIYDLYKKAHTPWNWIEKLVKILEKKNFPWFASAFDNSSVDFLEKLKCPAYKIASPEITDIGLINKISLTKKPIILSSGLSTLKDIDLAVKTIKKKHNKFAILKCVSSYPTLLKDLNLSGIKLLKKRYKCSIGFSDHTIGDLASKVAVSLGATIIEKHFKLNGDRSSIDSHFSMELSKLPKFKKDLQDVYECLGNETIKIVKSVKKNMSGKRSIYVVKNIKKGEKFNLRNIKSIRPSFGAHPKYLKRILGKKSTKDLEKGDRLKLSFINKKLR